jgi:hypothetical protein
MVPVWMIWREMDILMDGLFGDGGMIYVCCLAFLIVLLGLVRS